LLQHLCAGFGLVVLQVVGQEQAAGPGGAKHVALAAHQDAGVAQELVAAGIERRAGAPLADGRRHGLERELRQHVGNLLAHPGAPRRLDHDVLVVRQRGDRHFVVVREDRDLVLRARRRRP
jgi:hypothetical protein